MVRLIALIPLLLSSIVHAESDFYDEFVKAFDANHRTTASQYNNTENHFESSQPNYQPGYPGCPIFDKNGKLVVFGNEGGVSREEAIRYVDKYNRNSR